MQWYAMVNKGSARFVVGDKGAEKGDEILGALFISSMITWDGFKKKKKLF